MNNDIERLRRWIRPSTQPVYLRMEHPAMDDLAWAADRIRGLKAENARLKNALIATRNDLHEIMVGDMSTFEAQDAINAALYDTEPPLRTETANAQAALEARDARIRNEALREAAESAFEADDCYLARNTILALITEDQNDD